MDFNVFMERSGLGDKYRNAFAPYWNELCANCNDEMPEFMKMTFIRHYFPMTKIRPDLLCHLQTISDICLRNPIAALYASIMRYLVYTRPTPPPISIETLPPAEKLFGDSAGMFAVALVMSSFPLTEQAYAKLGIPQKYAEDFMQNLMGTTQYYSMAHHGMPGANFTWWHYSATKARLFHIGRLEFLLGPVPAWLPVVLRNKTTGDLRLLVQDGKRLTKDGRALEHEANDDFIAKLTYVDGVWGGTPITKDGYVLVNEWAQCSEKEWQPVLTPWDMVPTVHIPGGGKMYPEALKNSLIEARDFFHQYFNFDLKLVASRSWIFNPDWAQVMEGSHIHQFQQAGWLFPTNNRDKHSGLYFTFGSDDVDLNTFECTTSMQRKIAEHVKNGGTLCESGWLMLADDFEKFCN